MRLPPSPPGRLPTSTAARGWRPGWPVGGRHGPDQDRRRARGCCAACLDVATARDGHDEVGLLDWPAAQRRACLTVVEAGRYLGISRAKMYELLACGAVRSLTIGRSRRVPIAELDRFIDERLAVDAATP